MKSKSDSSVVVLVTAPTMNIARKLTRAAIEARLIACSNLLPKIESHYVWKGKVESVTEVLIMMKTTTGKVAALQEFVLKAHPYDTAEFVVLPITSGSKKYLDWIKASVA